MRVSGSIYGMTGIEYTANFSFLSRLIKNFSTEPIIKNERRTKFAYVSIKRYKFFKVYISSNFFIAR